MFVPSIVRTKGSAGVLIDVTALARRYASSSSGLVARVVRTRAAALAPWGTKLSRAVFFWGGRSPPSLAFPFHAFFLLEENGGGDKIEHKLALCGGSVCLAFIS